MKLPYLLVAVGAFVLPASANAAIIFQDSFEQETLALNYTSFQKWDVTVRIRRYGRAGFL